MFNTFLWINAALGVAALVCIFGKKLRPLLPAGFSSRKQHFAALAIAVVGLGASASGRSSAEEKDSEIAAEERITAAQDDRTIRNIKQRLVELGNQTDTNPVEVYQEVSNVLPRNGSLNQHPEIANLKKTIEELKKKTAKPYATYSYKQARTSLHDKKFTEAHSAIRRALKLDPSIPGAQSLADQIDQAIALDAANRSAISLKKTTSETLKKARAWVRTKEFVGASGLLSLQIEKLREHAQIHGELVGLSALETRLQKLHESIASKVAKQQNREAQEAKEQKELLAYCGRPPKQDSRGGVVDIAVHLMHTANDPDTIEVTACSAFVLDKNKCWVTTCSVRGQNSFGAKVLSRRIFALERDERDSKHYIVRSLHK